MTNEMEKCEQKGCDRPAVYIVYWPGQETRQCAEHEEGLRKLAHHMGFKLSSRLLYGRQTD